MTQNARQLPRQSIDGAVLDLTTTFDRNGNVTEVVDGTSGGRQSKSMGYDGLDRLVQASSPMFGNATYGYNTADNLTSVVAPGRSHTYVYNSLNQLSNVKDTATGSSVIGLSYDVQGNLANKNGVVTSFDFGNRLRATAGLTYRYDANGRRVRQDNAGTQLKYSYYAQDGRLVWQRDEVASKRINYVYLGGSAIAEYVRPIGITTATITYVHSDALGSPIAKTNSSGTVIETSEYEPYGKLLNRANDDRPGHTGHVMDSASGLTYMQQRYYDPQIGRFLSVDPVTAYEKPMSNFNRYAYANNNPYRFTDPDGRQSARIESGATEEQRRAAMEERARRQAEGRVGSGASDSGPRIQPAGDIYQLAGNIKEAVARRTSFTASGGAALGVGIDGEATKTTRPWQHDKVGVYGVLGLGAYAGADAKFRVFSWGDSKGTSDLKMRANPLGYFKLRVGLGLSVGIGARFNDHGGGALTLSFGGGFGAQAIVKPPATLGYEKEL